ncbi:type IV pilus biogenesis protein PilM [Halodesulfovibrio sp.]|jgi:hypothetical protein|uniref:type IV pilus biogenesis protein PilM n=1 Tax=Halodesulfovibrio sp. TaxID=1912772 RepID=UPI0025FCB5AC|nr:type IV pilus biogenesis protein PilM [Halodesulfovibrio sp.]MCT4625664.1 type IV pilus biogenesis protein PilM [Halodesulfovibrio sp.]
MKALAVLTFLLGVLALTQSIIPYGQDQDADNAMATNYAVYRNQVIHYAVKHPSSTGILSTAALGLPVHWRALRDWKNRIVGNHVYVYGEASAYEATAIQSLFKGSFAVGVKKAGRLESINGSGTALPAFIPENNIVTVIIRRPHVHP